MGRALTADEICRIISASAQAQVRELRFGDLHIQWGKQTPLVVPAPRPSPQRVGRRFAGGEPPAPSEQATPEPNHDQLNQEGLEQEELRLREQQIEDLLLTDPAYAEQLITEGQLGEVPDEPGRDVGEDS